MATGRKQHSSTAAGGMEVVSLMMAAGRKQHSLTATGGGEGVSSTAGGEEPSAPARKEENIF